MAKKNSKRREWTKTDIRELKTLARGKTPAGKIARALKRTEGATRQKAFSLGVSLDSRGCLQEAGRLGLLYLTRPTLVVRIGTSGSCTALRP
jgi:hypothetical protein